MTQEALKLALECAERCEAIDGMYSWSATITAIKEALAQTQEPWCMKMNGCKTKCEDCPDEPPQRTWVGLTDEEVELYWDWEDFQCGCGPSTLFAMVRDIESRLKDRNI